jgi:hypothetical protein
MLKPAKEIHPHHQQQIDEANERNIVAQDMKKEKKILKTTIQADIKKQRKIDERIVGTDAFYEENSKGYLWPGSPKFNRLGLVICELWVSPVYGVLTALVDGQILPNKKSKLTAFNRISRKAKRQMETGSGQDLNKIMKKLVHPRKASNKSKPFKKVHAYLMPWNGDESNTDNYKIYYIIPDENEKQYIRFGFFKAILQEGKSNYDYNPAIFGDDGIDFEEQGEFDSDMSPLECLNKVLCDPRRIIGSLILDEAREYLDYHSFHDEMDQVKGWDQLSRKYIEHDPNDSLEIEDMLVISDNLEQVDLIISDSDSDDNLLISDKTNDDDDKYTIPEDMKWSKVYNTKKIKGKRELSSKNYNKDEDVKKSKYSKEVADDSDKSDDEDEY